MATKHPTTDRSDSGTSADIVIEVEELTKRFGSLLATDDVNIQIERDELIGVAGPNGAGKTTLFNQISGFLSPSEGTIHVVGKDVTGSSPQEVVDAGLVRTFQEPRVIPSLTVLENVMVASLFAQGKSKAEGLEYASEVLERFDLQDLADKQSGELDFYQIKKLQLARVYATEAKVLLLDEPFAGLNQEEIDELVEMIKTVWNDHDRTILIIDHNFDSLTEFTNRIIILRGGQILADADPEVVKNDPEVKQSYIGEVE